MNTTTEHDPAGARPAWVDVLAAVGLMLGPAAGLGLGRFAYALLLPAMRLELGWSLTTAGLLTTANAVGYLLGAPLAAAAARRLGERRSFLVGIGLTALVLAATASSTDLAVLLALRLLAGISGAVCFVVGAGLAAQAGRSQSARRAGLLLSVYFAGGGVGILVSGLVIPSVVALAGWRGAWLLLGGLCLLCLAGAIPAARAVPQTPRDRENPTAWPRLRSLTALLGCYALYGAGYIAYATFIVADLQDGGASVTEIAMFWGVLGASAAVAAVAWPRLLASFSPRGAIVMMLLIVAIGSVLPVLARGLPVALGSAVIFGGSFLTVITTVTGAARSALPPQQWTSAIAALTTAFALGQCAGPVLAGAISNGHDGIRLGLLLGTGLLIVSAATAWLHPQAPATAS